MTIPTDDAAGARMYSEDHYATQRQWAESGLFALRRLLPTMSPVSRYSSWEPRQQETIGYLLSATARTTESTLLLCAYAQIWEAEVLARSTLEGSLKFAYLLQSRETFADRHREYADDLYKIALVKDHRKAKDLLALVPDSESETWRPLRDVLLPEDQFEELAARYGRATRKELETRWGFTGLIGQLAKSGDPYFSGITALAHSYAMASHVQHVDFVGAAIPMERDRRATDSRESTHLAHAARIISDALWFFFLRLAVGYRFVGADRSSLRPVSDLIEEACAPFGVGYSDWARAEYRD
jgi:hypothetical protein